MGYIKHNAIIVTSWDGDKIAEAHKKAREIFEWVSEISPSAINGYRSFFVPPDGSKEGWPESFNGDNDRKEFIKWCKSTEYADGSTPLSVIDVEFEDGTINLK